WLESLKAAGEWSSASTRLTALEGVNASARLTALEGLNASTRLAAHDLALGFVTNTASMKNSIARFKNLGTTVTSAQRTAIENEDWSDLYIGDNWTINGHKYYIAAFAHAYDHSKVHPLMYAPLLTSGQMNTTDTNSGGYYNSYMFNTFLPETVTPILQEDWGDLLINFYDRWPTSNASGICSTRSVSDTYKIYAHCMLPTYKMIYGHPFPGYGQDWNNLYGMRQLPFFAYWYNYTLCMTEFPGWLQDCANDSTQFVWCGREFEARTHGYDASESKYVSPLFFLG
ncbi:MAG: hypothetical protein IJS42_05785, partial [Synergistaceae bacterium]|nr:hypothetical protein [Synergistaceae bacterium]